MDVSGTILKTKQEVTKLKTRDFRDEKETHLEGRWATDTNCKMISNLLKAVRDVLLFETMAKAH